MKWISAKLPFVPLPASSTAGPSHRGLGAAAVPGGEHLVVRLVVRLVERLVERAVDPAVDFRAHRPAARSLRVALLVACATAVALAGVVGDPAPVLAADPELARLLRGMALLKASMVAAALAAIGWRFGHPIARRTAALYGVGAALVAGAGALVWQLSWLGPAALVFHGAGFALLLVAFADARGGRGARAALVAATAVGGARGPGGG